MDLLEQITQDRQAFLASSGRLPAVAARADAAPTPRDLAAPLTPPGAPVEALAVTEWTLPADAEHLPPVYRGLPVVAYLAGGSAAIEQKSRKNGALLNLTPPVAPAAVCPGCSGEFFWQALGDSAGERLNCCGCVAIPSRRMVVGFWLVAWDVAANQPKWAPWQPATWNPFEHLDAAQALAAVKANGGF